MVDFSAAASPLNNARLQQGVHPDAALRLLPHAAQFLFRGAREAARLAGDVFGPPLPLLACRAAQADARAALWLGPDEWLLLAPAGEASAVQAGIAGALGDVPHALVGVGHRNVALELTGAHASLVLNAGCPLNLAASAFPVGMCTRTVLAKAPIILWRTAPTTFHLGIWRSFAPYVWDYLLEARTRL